MEVEAQLRCVLVMYLHQVHVPTMPLRLPVLMLELAFSSRNVWSSSATVMRLLGVLRSLLLIRRCLVGGLVVGVGRGGEGVGGGSGRGCRCRHGRRRVTPRHATHLGESADSSNAGGSHFATIGPRLWSIVEGMPVAGNTASPAACMTAPCYSRHQSVR